MQVGALHAPLPFRTDIEGLRAVAIGLVVAAHAGVPGLQGGFVGVDVFFVLSGYLITRILAHDSRPSLPAFYAARLRRLLPALLTMFALTLAAAALLLAPMEQLQQAPIAAAVPLWLANVALAAREVQYFGAGADTMLWQHTWSLALEEQFYLVWPLLLLTGLGAWRPPTAPRAVLARWRCWQRCCLRVWRGRCARASPRRWRRTTCCRPVSGSSRSAASWRWRWIRR